MSETFTCEACGGTFGVIEGWDAERERDIVFGDVPADDFAVVCGKCLTAMRAAFPTLDARFKLQGL